MVSPASTEERNIEQIAAVDADAAAVLPSRLSEFPVLVHRSGGRRFLPQSAGPRCPGRSEAFPAGEQARFEREFGIRIAHWYGHSEYAALAYFCRECHGFHFYPTYGQVELLPSETERLPADRSLIVQPGSAPSSSGMTPATWPSRPSGTAPPMTSRASASSSGDHRRPSWTSRDAGDHFLTTRSRT